MGNAAYYTFFLCAYQWATERTSLVELTDFLVDSINRNCYMECSLTTGEDHSSKMTRKRLSPEGEEFLLLPSLEYFHLAATNLWHTFVVFSLDFWRTSKLFSPEYACHIFPEVPECREDLDVIKTFSFSIERRIFRYRFHGRRKKRLLDLVERAFVDLEAVYGFGGETRFPGRSAFDQRTSDQYSKSRVIDFDYRSYIEGIFDYNFLSTRHVENNWGRIERLKTEKSIEVRELRSPASELHGVGIHAPKRKGRVSEILEKELRALMPEPEPDVSIPYFLLMRTDLVEAVGGIDSLRTSPVLKEVAEHPGGLVEAELKILETDSLPELREWCEQERALFQPYYAQAGRTDLYPHEDLVQYPGLFDEHVMYQRLPRIEAERYGYALLYVEDRSQFESSMVHFLIKPKQLADDIQSFKSLFMRWLDLIKGHPDEYGAVEIGDESLASKPDGWHHVCYEANLSHLRQAAINLLMVMLDDLNKKRCVVHFVVLGKIDPSRYLPEDHPAETNT